MKRASAPTKKKTAGWECPDAGFAVIYPKLAEFLCDGTWDDGKPRDVGSLTVRMGGDSVFVSLTDYESKSSLFTNAESLTEALGAIETALANGMGKWRRWKK